MVIYNCILLLSTLRWPHKRSSPDVLIESMAICHFDEKWNFAVLKKYLLRVFGACSFESSSIDLLRFDLCQIPHAKDPNPVIIYPFSVQYVPFFLFIRWIVVHVWIHTTKYTRIHIYIYHEFDMKMWEQTVSLQSYSEKIASETENSASREIYRRNEYCLACPFSLVAFCPIRFQNKKCTWYVG